MARGRDLFASQVGPIGFPRRPRRPGRTTLQPGATSPIPIGLDYPKGFRSPNINIAAPAVLGTTIGPTGQPILDPNPNPLNSRWWEQPGAQFRTVIGRGGKEVRQVQVPNDPRWIPAVVPAEFRDEVPDPETFYGIMQSLGPELGLFFIANAQSSQQARDDTAQAVSGAVTGLRGVQTQYGAALDAFRNDPEAARILAELNRRSSPEYRAVTEIEESAMMNELAQNIALATDAALANAGFRGVSQGPGTAQRVSAVGALGESGALGLRRGVAESNRRAQSEALGQLEDFRRSRHAGELSLLGALGDVERQIAAIESGQEFVPTDYFPLAELQFGQEAFQTARDFADRALTAEEAAAGRAEAAATPDIWDWLGAFGALGGTGAFQGNPLPWLQWLAMAGQY